MAPDGCIYLVYLGVCRRYLDLRWWRGSGGCGQCWGMCLYTHNESKYSEKMYKVATPLTAFAATAAINLLFS